jgi:hypothetical protein
VPKPAPQESKEGPWTSRIYSYGNSQSLPEEEGRKQQMAKQQEAPTNTTTSKAAAAPSQNRLSVDSWYYSLTDTSPNGSSGG